MLLGMAPEALLFQRFAHRSAMTAGSAARANASLESLRACSTPLMSEAILQK
jgi:hypothetical protein